MPEPVPPETRPAARPDTRRDLDHHDAAFAVADRLAVHSAQCVCPPCAGRLPGLLVELARALDDVDRRPVR